MPLSTTRPGDERALHELLERFRQQHPDGDAESLRRWAASDAAKITRAEDIERLIALHEEPTAAEALLAPHAEAEAEELSFFGHKRGGNEGPSAEQGTLQPGKRLGRFVLREFLAKGGMGQVWVAEDSDLRRDVALKLVLPDRINDRTLQMFQREARAGGRLSHPNLVATHAYGTDEGLTWISQELVEGSWTLKDFLEEARKEESTPKNYYREVAGLVASIAAGLEAAHQAGVIHRDLKPANILITEDEVPKITDFGLARVKDDSFLSVTGQLVGTWAYMSPEQITAKRMGLDHRTDVFSLGVVMYELLTQRRPFDGDTTAQLAEQIMYEDPRPVGVVRSQCPEELSVICGKALEKRPQDRYQSAAELAADLRRYLANEPILAKPPGPVTRSLKWVQRHPAISSASAIGAIALVVVSALLVKNVEANEELASTNARLDTSNIELERRGAELEESNSSLDAANAELERAAIDLQAQTELARRRAQEAEDERDRAAELLVERDEALAETERRARELEQVARFQEEQLSSVDAAAMGQRLRESLALRMPEPSGSTAGDAGAQVAGLEEQLKQVDFTGLALETLDQTFFLPALEVLAGAEYEQQPLLRARLRQVLADVLCELGRLDLAGAPQRQAVATRRELLGDTHPTTLSSINSMGLYLIECGELSEAELRLLEALEGFRSTGGLESEEPLALMNNLCVLLQMQGELGEAEELARESLEVHRRVLGEESPSTLSALNNMVGVLFRQGRIAEAEQLLRETLATRREVLGPGHPETLSSLHNLSMMLQMQGKLDEAEPLCREAHETLRGQLGEEHPRTLEALGSLAVLLQARGQLEEAGGLLRKVLEGRRSQLGPTHPSTLNSIHNLGLFLQQQGRPGEAEPLFREAVAGSREGLGDAHPETLGAVEVLALFLLSQGREPEAIETTEQFLDSAELPLDSLQHAPLRDLLERRARGR